MISMMVKGLFMIKKKNQNTMAILKMAKNLEKVNYKVKVFIIEANGLITCMMAKDH